MLESRPTRWAGMVSPSAVTTAKPSSSGSGSSAVTISPARQTNPVLPNRPERIETRLGAVFATDPERACDRATGAVRAV